MARCPAADAPASLKASPPAIEIGSAGGGPVRCMLLPPAVPGQAAPAAQLPFDRHAIDVAAALTLAAAIAAESYLEALQQVWAEP